ncbi:MAG TPA: hypothetical protein VFB32_07380 [Rudaea sp.]|jgi:hypothetical protein|nr:hypothetical protein [Rudaea sp.]
MHTDGQIAWHNVSDEELTREFLQLSNSGKRGTRVFQSIEAEMRARNLLRSEGRFSTSYTGARSSNYDTRPLLFAGYSSFR